MPLPDVLGTAQLPLAELSAARLDGELVALGGGYHPVDLPETPMLRASSLALGVPPRLIAELGTAAWLWGADPVAPVRLEFCSRLSERARMLGAAGIALREVVLEADEIARIGPLRVTTPRRTACDLLRHRERLGARDRAAIRELGRVGGFALAELRGVLAERSLPGSARALARLSELAQPP